MCAISVFRCLCLLYGMWILLQLAMPLAIRMAVIVSLVLLYISVSDNSNIYVTVSQCHDQCKSVLAIRMEHLDQIFHHILSLYQQRQRMCTI